MIVAKFLHIFLFFLVQTWAGKLSTDYSFYLRVTGIPTHLHLNWRHLQVMKDGGLGLAPVSLPDLPIAPFQGVLRDGRLFNVKPRGTVVKNPTHNDGRLGLSNSAANIGFMLLDETGTLGLPNRILATLKDGPPSANALAGLVSTQFYLCPVPSAKTDYAKQGGFEWVDSQNLHVDHVLHHPYYLYTTQHTGCIPAKIITEGLGQR